MTVENTSWSPLNNVVDPSGVEHTIFWSPVRHASNRATKAGCYKGSMVCMLHMNYFNFPHFYYVSFAWILLEYCMEFASSMRKIFLKVAWGFHAWTNVSMQNLMIKVSPKLFVQVTLLKHHIDVASSLFYARISSMDSMLSCVQYKRLKVHKCNFYMNVQTLSVNFVGSLWGPYSSLCISLHHVWAQNIKPSRQLCWR